jgi:hypothetical protein
MALSYTCAVILGLDPRILRGCEGMTGDRRKILGSSPRMTPLGVGTCGAVHLRCTLRFSSSAHPGVSRDERYKECAMVRCDWIPAFAGNAAPKGPLAVTCSAAVALVLRRTRSFAALLGMSAWGERWLVNSSPVKR